MKILQSASVNIGALSEDEKFYLYNGLDCCVTKEVFDELEPKIGEAEETYTFTRAMQAPAYALMKRGVKIDLAERDRALSSLGKIADRCKHIFNRLCEEGLGRTVLYSSPKQLKELFYELLKLEPVLIYNKSTGENSPSTNREALEKLNEKYPIAQPFVELILKLRDIDKKIQVLRCGIVKGRMHCSYNVAGTMTGRWSSSESAFGSGTNFQNITDELRQMFVPDNGKKICQLDLKQAESKVVAYLAMPWGRKYLDAVNTGDPHTYVCKMIWKSLPWGSAKDKVIAEQSFYRHYSYRFMAKKGGHAGNYCVTAFKLAHELKIPLALAEEFLRRYLFDEFPEIRHWQNSVKVQLASSRCIVSATGRRCHFPGRPWDNDTIKSAVAYNPQGTIGDILNKGLNNVFYKYDALFGGPIEVLLQVHDAIVFQYDPEIERTIVPLIRDELVSPITINGEVCRVEAEAAIGWNWGKVIRDNSRKIIANPYGLDDYSDTERDTRSAPTTSPLNRSASSFHLVFK